MRIGIFLSSLGLLRGGLETIAANFAGELARRGHHVTCVAGNGLGRTLPGDLASLPVQWVRVPCLPVDHFLWAGASPRSAGRRLKAQSLSYSAACWLAPAVRGLLAAADVTLSLLEIETVCISRRRARYGRGHLSYFPGVIDRRWFERDRSPVRVAISHTLADSTPGVSVDGIVTPGIDAGWLDTDYQVVAQAETLLFTGRLEANKGVWELLQLFQMLAPGEPQLHLRLIGEGPLRGELEAWAVEAGLADRIHFLGGMPSDDVQRELQGADLFLFPSQYESFGIAVVEAQAAGVPVVCSDLPVMQEVTGGAACTLPPRAVERWARAVSELLADPAERQRLSEAGRRNARRYAWPRVVNELERYLSLAQEVAGEGHHGA